MRRSTTATAEQVVLFELIGEDFEGCPHFWSGKKRSNSISWIVAEKMVGFKTLKREMSSSEASAN